MFHDTQMHTSLAAPAVRAYCAEQRRVCEADFQCALFEDAPDKDLSVYALRDPAAIDPFGHRDGAIFYVGQTDNAPRRFCEHVRPKDRAGQNLGKRAQILAIQQSGKSPRMELLNRVPTRHCAVKVEQQWIQYFRQMGYALTNGGRGKPGFDFSHCLEPDGQAENRMLFELAQSGTEIMLQCLECCHLVWRDPAELIATDFPPGMKIAEFRAHMRTCEHCGSGAIIAGVEDAGEVT